MDFGKINSLEHQQILKFPGGSSSLLLASGAVGRIFCLMTLKVVDMTEQISDENGIGWSNLVGMIDRLTKF